MVPGALNVIAGRYLLGSGWWQMRIIFFFCFTSFIFLLVA